MSEAPRRPLLEMRGIEKSFGNLAVLRGIDFDLEAGEVHALLGENGAGKSTLVKIIAGAHRPTSGSIRIEGREVRLRSPMQARGQGIAVMYQETSLYRDLSVLENLFVGRYRRRRFGTLDWPKMRVEAERVFATLGVEMPLRQRVAHIGKAQAQLVEIARALLQDARIMIMDEPTAALTSGEVDRLFRIVSELKAKGTAVIYISHRLEEIARIADRVTVFRDGQRVGTERMDSVSPSWLIEAMLGRALGKLYPRNLREPGRALLEVESLGSAGKFHDVSLAVREGEIVGLAGLVGAGRSEVVRCLFGIDAFDAGTIRFDGKAVALKPWTAVGAGLGLLPEDRGRDGVLAGMPVRFNLSLAALGDFCRYGFVNRQSEGELASRMVRELDIRPPRPEAPIESLSGGNQQKVVLGRWLAIGPKLLMLDEPTQGVDVGAKAEIHRLIDGLVNRGVGVLMVSSDLPEVLGMSDRILVMSQGRMVAEFGRGVGADEVMAAAGRGRREAAHAL